MAHPPVSHRIHVQISLNAPIIGHLYSETPDPENGHRINSMGAKMNIQ